MVICSTGVVGDSGEDGGVVGGGADAVDLMKGDAADGAGGSDGADVVGGGEERGDGGAGAESGEADGGGGEEGAAGEGLARGGEGGAAWWGHGDSEGEWRWGGRGSRDCSTIQRQAGAAQGSRRFGVG